MESGERLDWPLLVLKMEGGHNTEYRQPLEAGRTKLGSPLEPPERNTVLPTS